MFVCFFFFFGVEFIIFLLSPKCNFWYKNSEEKSKSQISGLNLVLTPATNKMSIKHVTKRLSSVSKVLNEWESLTPPGRDTNQPQVSFPPEGWKAELTKAEQRSHKYSKLSKAGILPTAPTMSTQLKINPNLFKCLTCWVRSAIISSACVIKAWQPILSTCQVILACIKPTVTVISTYRNTLNSRSPFTDPKLYKTGLTAVEAFFLFDKPFTILNLKKRTRTKSVKQIWINYLTIGQITSITK